MLYSVVQINSELWKISPSLIGSLMACILVKRKSMFGRSYSQKLTKHMLTHLFVSNKLGIVTRYLPNINLLSYEEKSQVSN